MIVIVQYLCPQRHAILGAAYDEDNPEFSFDGVCAGILGELKRLAIRNRCGICGSTDLHFETTKTGFKTLKDAAGPIAESMVNQLATRARLEAEGKTVDSQERLRNN